MLEPGTGPVFLMAYSFADMFRVYKNNLKLAVCHCGWVRECGFLDTQPLREPGFAWGDPG